MIEISDADDEDDDDDNDNDEDFVRVFGILVERLATESPAPAWGGTSTVFNLIWAWT